VAPKKRSNENPTKVFVGKKWPKVPINAQGIKRYRDGNEC